MESPALSQDALVEVFKRLPLLDLLASAGPQVCRDFRVAYADKVLWSQHLPPTVLAAAGQQPLRPLALRQLLSEHNLLRHADFQPPANGEPWAWRNVYIWNADAWDNEGQHARGADSVPLPPPPLAHMLQEGPPTVGVMASSYVKGVLVQSVDLAQELEARGLSSAAAEELLDSSPTLELKLYATARFDCYSWCRATILLDDGTVDYGDRFALDSFEGVVEEPGVLGAASSGIVELKGVEWRPLSVRASGGGVPGVRRAVVVLEGKDRKYWAGYYGAKLASPTLRFAPPAPGQG